MAKDIIKGEEEQKIAEEIISFSKHLMIILVASIALSASISLKETISFVKIILSAGVIAGVISFCLGYEANIKYINARKKRDKDLNLMPAHKKFHPATIEKIQKYVEWQFKATICSLIAISSSIILSVFFNISDPPKAEENNITYPNNHTKILRSSERNQSIEKKENSLSKPSAILVPTGHTAILSTKLHKIQTTTKKDLTEIYSFFQKCVSKYISEVPSIDATAKELMIKFYSNSANYPQISPIFSDWLLMKEKESASVEKKQVIILFFEHNKSNIPISGLNKIDTLIKEYNSKLFILFGFTDTTGNISDNRYLAENRINSVKDTLINKGISDNRIITIPKGEVDLPIATNNDVKEPENRRVDVYIF